jgi:hypothetical protein
MALSEAVEQFRHILSREQAFDFLLDAVNWPDIQHMPPCPTTNSREAVLGVISGQPLLGSDFETIHHFKPSFRSLLWPTSWQGRSFRPHPLHSHLFESQLGGEIELSSRSHHHEKAVVVESLHHQGKPVVVGLHHA